MAYNATALHVMIASPGDVLEERNLVRDIIHEWNDIHSVGFNLVLLPVGWETHSAPELGGRPQDLINKRVLEKCDLLVGVFWTRIGTPTGEAESGTSEEIRRHVESGKPAMVYFSTAPVAPSSLDAQQYDKLREFKDWCKQRGLIEEYDNLETFAEKFRRQLQITVRDNEFIQGAIAAVSKATGKQDSITDISSGQPFLSYNEEPTLDLSQEAKRLLIEASRDKQGTILSVRYLGGQSIQTNSINFAESGDRRSVARWEAALEQLLEHGLIIARGYKNEIFELTAKGYEVSELLRSDLGE